MRHAAFVTSKAGPRKDVVFHEGGLSKGTLLYPIMHMYMCYFAFLLQVYIQNVCL